MAEHEILRSLFGKRSRYGTPLTGIWFSASGVILVSWLSFEEIVAAENFLYCFGMIMEFVAFVKLRMKYPLTGLIRLLVGTAGARLMCIPPTLLIFVVLTLASFKVMIVSLLAGVMGLVMQPCLKCTKTEMD